MSRSLMLLLVIAIPSLAFSQDEKKPEPARPDPAEVERAIQDADEGYDDVIVVAGRHETSIFRTPRATHRVDDRDFTVGRSRGTLPDTLRDVPGIHLQRTGPGLTSPFLRGLTSFHTVLTVDGIRLNSSVFRPGPNQYWNTVDQMSVERVEAVMGLTSVLYGSDAIGGTVGAFTQTVDMGTEGAGWTFGGRAAYRFSTAEASHVARGSAHVGYDGRFGAIVGFTYKDFGDVDGGGHVGRQSNTAYDAHAADLKFRLVAADDVEVEFLFQRARLNNVPRVHSTVNGTSFHGTAVGSNLKREFDQERDLALATVYVYDGSFFEEAQFKVAYQNQYEIEDRIRASGRRDKRGFDVDTLAVVGQLESDVSIGTIVYGVDVYADFVDSFANRFDPGTGTFTVFDQGSVGDDATYVTIGVFGQGTFELCSWATLVVGIRYTHIEVDVNTVVDPMTGDVFGFDDSYDSLVGSVRFLFEATDHLTFFVGGGVGFRGPNLSDLTRFDSARSDEVETPAIDLDPEHFVGGEIGAKVRTDDFAAQATYFYTELIDTIVRAPTGAVIDMEFEVTKRNAGDGYVHGVELAFAWDFLPEWTFSGAFAWVEGKSDTFPTSMPIISREPLSKMPPLSARLALRWQPADCNFWIEAQTEIVDEQDRLSTRDLRDTQRIPPGGTPGYTLYHLRAGYDIDEKKSVFLHVENISNKNYRHHGSGVQEPGFNVIVGFDMRF